MQIKNTYGTPHNVGSSSIYVKDCDRYRVSLVGVTTPGDGGHEDRIKVLKDNGYDIREEGYGLIFLESEEVSVTYFGSIEQVEKYKKDGPKGPANLDTSKGVFYGSWPQGKGWDDFIPRVFWNRSSLGATADGIGIVTAFEHPVKQSAEVIVYEFEGKWRPDDPAEYMITYHCTACHSSCKDVHINRGPHDRRWIARKARAHIVSAAQHGVNRDGRSECRPPDPRMLPAVNEVAKKNLGVTHDVLPNSEDVYCATRGPCAVIRELRAGVRPDVYQV